MDGPVRRNQGSRAEDSEDLQGRTRFLLPEVLVAIVRL